MARRINAPGTEVNEIDRSGYNQYVDNSTIGTTTLVLGFADKGDEYNVKWMNTMTTFNQTYGTPQTEAEKYFYNAVYEILVRNGVCYTAKLPYYNDSNERYIYTSYSIDNALTKISSVIDVMETCVSQTTNTQLSDCLFFPTMLGDESTVSSVVKEITSYNSVYDFRQFVEQTINADIPQQQLFDKACYDNVHKNLFTTILSIIVSYDGDPQNLNNPYTDGIVEFADEISSLHDSIIMAFETSNITDIITNFIKKLYINDIKSYYSDISSQLNNLFILDDTQKLQEKYTEIRTIDDSITSFVKISADVSSSNEMMTFENYDKFLIKELKVPQNKIYIVDKTRGKYEKDTFGNEVIGIMPVIVTPTNAIFYQELIRKNDALLNDYNVIAKVRNSYRTEQLTRPYSTSLIPFDQDDLTVDNYEGESRQFVGLGEYLGLESNATVNDYSVSQAAAEQFPLLKFLDGRLDREHLNKIGVVVFKLFRDSSNENRISFSPVESFVGSLDREARDETTNAKIFIDDIVNNNSDYISIFSNANIPNGQDTSPTGIKNADTFVICNQTACSMGFYESDTVKYIHVTNSIYNPILKIFEKYEDKNILDIDLIVDGGVSNIAQFIASTCKVNPKTQAIVNEPFSRFGLYDLDSPTAYLYNSLDTHSHVNVWKKVLQRYDEFVKNTRKDCLFIADGPRPFCLEGNSKIVRPSKPKNTIKNSILPKLKYVSNVVNSSYSTGYLNWFWSLDHSTGDYIWMPPSIKAVGVYIYTDTYGAFWDAPAGVNRGHVLDTLDVAFNPTNDEAGQIYINSWNYAISYPLDGIVLEGQKTFQRNKTALDRVNVRRLMLGMEKTLRSMLKYFNYEGNTEFLRSRIKDAADNYLNQVRANDGISEYIVVCDERNNTPENIDNNELHVAIAIKPIKSIEFIILGFLCTNQSVDVEEALQSELNNM